MSKKSIAVIGGGVVGLVLSKRLVEEGWQVTIFSSKTKATASLAAHGSFSVKGIIHPHEPFFERKLIGMRKLKSLIKDLERKTSKALPVFSQRTIEVFSSLQEYQRIKKCFYHREFTGGLPVRLWSRKKIMEEKSFSFGYSAPLSPSRTV